MLPSTKFADQTATVGILGLGYVGLPLLLGYAEKGIKAIGFDVDEFKITSLKNGKSYIQHIGSGPY